jgi:hypothetical protein
VNDIDTFYHLMAEFRTIHVKAELVTEKYLGLDRKSTMSKANKGELPFPTFKEKSERAPLLVDLRDVASWLDDLRDRYRSDWRKLQSCYGESR